MYQFCIPIKYIIVQRKYITKHIPSSKTYLLQLSIPAKDILVEHKYITNISLAIMYSNKKRMSLQLLVYTNCAINFLNKLYMYLYQLCIPTKDIIVQHKYITKYIPSNKAYL